MTEDVSAEVQKKLLQLKRDYVKRLGKELAALHDQALAMLGHDNERATWVSIRERLHRLAGSAGTFGFAGIGETCRALESRLDRALSYDSRVEFDDVLKGLLAIHADVAESAVEPPPASAVVEADAPQPEAHASREWPLIFVLEDDQDVGEQLCLVLESFQYEARLFTAGDALERACQLQRPDALILDLHLDDREIADGLSIGETIQRTMTPTIPLFVVTQSQDFDVQLRAVRTGVEGFFPKPVEPLRLADALGARLRQHRMPPSRVLMVDDDETLLTHHRLVLEAAGFAVMTINRPEEALQALESFTPDVLVLDVRMPQCSGPELAQIVRYHPRWLQVPIVYLSATGDAGVQLSAMTKAGDDFLVKPIAPEALVASVTARARRARALAAALARDGLTGLLKHADIKERLTSALSQSRRRQQPLSVVMLDIDHFKRVNDTYGHLTGDEVIRALANLLRRRLRESDLIGRYGGEEFLIVLNDCIQLQAVQLIDELRESFGVLQFRADEASFSCTFSAGVVTATLEHDAEALIGDADQCLYRAKRAGRNRVAAGEDCVTGSHR